MAPQKLADLCLQTIVDHLDYIGDVGDTDLDLLEKILIHCNVEQLQRIEDATADRDLTPVTDNLWQKCYVRKYGVESMETVTTRMKKRGVAFQWRVLYEAKAKEQEETQQRCVNRLRELYLEAEQKKQSRQIQLVNMVPPKGKKRKFSPAGGSSASSRPSSCGSGSNLMKKARMEFARSHDKMVYANLKKRPLSKLPPTSRPSLGQIPSTPCLPARANPRTGTPLAAPSSRGPQQPSRLAPSSKRLGTASVSNQHSQGVTAAQIGKPRPASVDNFASRRTADGVSQRMSHQQQSNVSQMARSRPTDPELSKRARVQQGGDQKFSSSKPAQNASRMTTPNLKQGDMISPRKSRQEAIPPRTPVLSHSRPPKISRNGGL